MLNQMIAKAGRYDAMPISSQSMHAGKVSSAERQAQETELVRTETATKRSW